MKYHTIKKIIFGIGTAVGLTLALVTVFGPWDQYYCEDCKAPNIVYIGSFPTWIGSSMGWDSQQKIDEEYVGYLDEVITKYEEEKKVLPEAKHNDLDEAITVAKEKKKHILRRLFGN